MTATLPRLEIRNLAVFGAALVIVFFGLFGAWMALAPLSKGAVALGTVGTDSQSKRVEHLEGGIVDTLHVREGNLVEPGQILLKLEATQAEADVKAIAAKVVALLCREMRLLAERDQLAWLSRSEIDQSLGLSRDLVHKVFQDERRIFEARRSAMAGQKLILMQRIKQLTQDIEGLEAEIDSRTRQRGLIREELKAAETLITKGLKRRPEFLELRRREMDLDGKIARSKSITMRTRLSITETELRMRNLTDTRHDEIVRELSEVRSRLEEVCERLRRARDILARTTVRAPFRGHVVDLGVIAAGEVVSPGEELMQIVPVGETAVIDARVKPTDIDIVHPGMTAQILFTGFDQASIPLFDGKVRSVSADAVSDERTGETYCAVRVDILQGGGSVAGLELRPGMPAELLIVDGSRTTLEYLLQPISDTLSSADSI